MRGLTAALLLLTGCQGCAAAFHGPPPPRRIAEGQIIQRIHPTPFVRVQWALMEYCMGRTEPIELWRFYVVWADSWIEPALGSVVGYTDSPTRTIYLAATTRDDVPVIRHEILHALGAGWHSAVAFKECGASPSHMPTFIPRYAP